MDKNAVAPKVIPMNREFLFRLNVKKNNRKLSNRTNSEDKFR